MPRPLSLKSLRFVNYKGFADYSISLRQANVLIGANNAGKSTALEAIRLLASMLPSARRAAPSTAGAVAGSIARGWPITTAAIDASAFSEENIRHDFRYEETRIEATASSGARLVACWPAFDDEEVDDGQRHGTYFVFSADGAPIRAPRDIAREEIPTIGVVPTLTPLDNRESYVSDETLRRNITGRRSSRYFRNALHRLAQDQWNEFKAFVFERTPEVTGLMLRHVQTSEENSFDLFYQEDGTRHEREIGWAGDGIQIWLQALYHIWSLRESPVVVLDEPDVFLHPDLQRRLARSLFASADRQIIVATHSVEILAEAQPGSAVWIDRSRRRAERPKPDGALGVIGRRLGSGYELGVGRALRSPVAVFVEGDDAPVLAILARRLGKTAVADSDRYATIPLGGFSRNWRAAAFSETMQSLGATVRTFVLLDRDLRSAAAVDLETAAVRSANATVHVWRRRELENYLLSPGAISRAAGISSAEAELLLEGALSAGRDEAMDAMQAQRLAERRLQGSATSGHSERTVLETSRGEFETLWSSQEGRLGVVDAKIVIRSLNKALQERDARTLNSHALARSMPTSEIPDEVVEVLDEISLLIVGGAAT